MVTYQEKKSGYLCQSSFNSKHLQLQVGKDTEMHTIIRTKSNKLVCNISYIYILQYIHTNSVSTD